MIKRFLTILAMVCGLTAGAGETSATGPETLALKELVRQQREVLARAAAKSSQQEIEDMREEVQSLVFRYEDYLLKYPNVAAGYVSYALLLNQPLIGERRKAAALLLKANELDPNLPLVKNQLGNYLAEEGKPVEALNYYLAAVKLAPEEPLYHYQVGTLLTEARDDFLKTGMWTRATLDQSMQEAFERASALAPGNVAYAYRFGESFYDLEQPEWSAALAYWRALEAKLQTRIEKDTVRLHQANVLIEQAKFEEARAALATVETPQLEAQKQKLVARLPAKPAQ